MILKREHSLHLPPGPFAHIPVPEENGNAYLVYCVCTNCPIYSFGYLDSVHLAEMDACVLATALNVLRFKKAVSLFVKDSKRLEGYREFRNCFPGSFQVLNTSFGQVESYAIACSDSEIPYCQLVSENAESTVRAWASSVCDAMNSFVSKVDARLEAAGRSMQFSAI